MANDDPRSLRMDFGYKRARASGVTGFQESRSVRQINPDLERNQAVRQLNYEVKKDPDWSRFVAHWIREGVSPQDVLQSLWNAQHDAWRRRKGYAHNRYAPF